MTEVAIIGAGPTGSVAAILLAREGWSVTLIEQHRFPRDKVCGECLSAVGIESLRRVRLLDEVRKLNPMTLTRATIHSVGGGRHLIPLSRCMWGVSRRALDQHLLDLAQEAGANLLQPARCERVEANPLRVRVRHLEGNRIETLRPDWLFIADGKANFCATVSPPNDFGIKAHFEGLDGPRDTIELFGCQGLYGGLAPIEDQRWNAAFSVPAQRLRKHKGNIQSLFEQVTNENHALAERLGGARRVSDWAAAPLPRYAVRPHWPDRVIPVGNAAAAIEPIGGEGMGLAIRSAELAAQALIAGGQTHWLRKEYRRLWNMRRVACRTAGLVVSSPLASKLLLPLLDIAPAVSDVTLALLGKAVIRSP